VPGALILGLEWASGVSLTWVNCLLLELCVRRVEDLAELEIAVPDLRMLVLGHLVAMFWVVMNWLGTALYVVSMVWMVGLMLFTTLMFF
jgi:hypothetical protein